jgi:2-amino-4-hydroxy-6-hydroxymethyldihydropteridine diphosphokinase
MCERAFVLVPLGEIAPQLKIPGCEKTVAELLEILQSKGETNAVVRVESNVWRAAAQP